MLLKQKCPPTDSHHALQAYEALAKAHPQAQQSVEHEEEGLVIHGYDNTGTTHTTGGGGGGADGGSGGGDVPAGTTIDLSGGVGFMSSTLQSSRAELLMQQLQHMEEKERQEEVGRNVVVVVAAY